MQAANIVPSYRVWDITKTAQEPVELPTLVAWIKSKRVNADTWVFLDHTNSWVKASQLAELKMFFSAKPAAGATGGAAPSAVGQAMGVKPGSLRRIKIFADMDDEQLEGFLRYMEVVKASQYSHVVRKGDHGDAMYFVLEGEVRAMTLIDGKESTLATITAGEFFGEVSLLDQGPRSADVIANKESVLLKISAGAIEKVVREAPELATPFLFALSRSVVNRVRTLTKRYEDSIHFSRMAGAVH